MTTRPTAAQDAYEFAQRRIAEVKQARTGTLDLLQKKARALETLPRKS